MSETIRVLHVDDDVEFLTLTSDFLKDHVDDLDVTTVTKVAEGLEILQEREIDCVVSDYDMPEINGLSFLEKVRSEHPDMPFILFTGKGSEEIASEAISAGVTDYLQKKSGTEQYELLANRIKNYVSQRRAEEELQERERMFSTLISNLPGMVYRCRNEPEWPMEFVSEGCLELTGYRPSELESDEILWGSDITHPDDRGNMWDEIQSALKRNERFEVTYRIHTKDGEEKWVWEQGQGVYSPDGSVEALEGFITDITDMKLMEDKLREREEEVREERDRLSALFENIPDPVVNYEYEGGEPMVRRVNSAFEEVFGYDSEAIVGEPLDDLVVPPDKENEAKDLNEKVDQGNRLEVEVRRKTSEGLRDFLLRSAPLRSSKENTEGYALYIDITERKEHERQLERNQEMLTALHQATRDMMNAESKQEVCDIAVETADEVLGFSSVSIYLFNEFERALHPVSYTSETEEMFDELPVFTEGSSLAWNAFETGELGVYDDVHEQQNVYNPDTPVRSELIIPVGGHGIFMTGKTEARAFSDTDIEFAQLLIANVETTLDSVHRHEMLIERERELERQNKRLEEFADVVSHDLRNPLNVAQGNLELARKTNDLGYLDKVERSHERMENMIEDLLKLARQGQAIGETQEVNLKRVVEDAWSNIDAHTTTLEVDGLNDITVEADEDSLRRVFENLFRNSVEHAGEGVRARVGPISAKTEDEQVRGFYVEDDGVGIPEELREKVFEQGYSKGGVGAGLGLSIVKEIIDAHGWDVSLKESAEGGTRFEITFPQG
ncbi:MAG: PAS domain-containing protein [Halobacteria archaeon]|nr:PAS domain-containing protein [Halobacteria archaeon]